MKSMIIIPTYNEKDNIVSLAHAILSLPTSFTSRSWTITRRRHRCNCRFPGAGRPKSPRHPQAPEAGLGTAYVQGFRWALDNGMDCVFEMDADFSHDPKYLHDMLVAIKDADVVIGSRYIEGVRVNGWRFRRLLLSKFANMFASYIIVIPVWDFTAGFNCYRRRVLERIGLDRIRSDGYSFQIEMKTYAYRLGFRLKEIPIIFGGREHGDSKLNRRIAWEAFWTVLRLRSSLLDIIRHLKFLSKDYREFVKGSEN